jgi:hypothetical protein
MKVNQWTLGLAAAGVINLASAVNAEEAPSQLLTALSSTTLSGYVDTSANWKVGTGRQIVGRFNDGTSKQDQFNLNVVKLSLEKPLSNEGEWSAGYKVDLLFGPDAGLYNPSSINSSLAPGGVFPSLGDAAIKQAFVAVRAPVGNGLEFKMGVFDTIIGYEVFESPNNPNFSRSYGWTLEPTQHTGILANYRITDWMSVAGGVANTYNAGIGFQAARATTAAGGVLPPSTPASESEKTYMGSFTLTAPESFGGLKGAALYAGVIDGLNNALSPTAGDTTSFYVGTTIPLPITGLAVGAAYDYRATQVLDPVTGGKNANYANAVSLYTSYTMNSWKFNNRIEYASGSFGTFGASTGGNGGTAPKDPGTSEELLSETFTVDYSLWANVLSRVEFRWDRDLKGRHNGAYPYGIDDRNALTLALNLVYKF